MDGGMCLINVVLRKNGFVILGHAQYDEYGKDIVCSAVSSLTQTIAMGIEKFCNGAYMIDKGDLSVVYDKDNTMSKFLIETMLLGLREIEKDYPNNLKIREVKS